MVMETNGGAVWGKQGAGRGCSAIRGRTDIGFLLTITVPTLLHTQTHTLLQGADTTCPLEATLSRTDGLRSLQLIKYRKLR